MPVWFKGAEERKRAYANVVRIGALLGNESIPSEDVIDLAQAIRYIMEDIFTADSLK